MAALAEQCGNHPLALRIAAERLGATSAGRVAEAVDRLSDRQARLDALSVGGDETSAIRAVFMWSYDALDADHKRLFRFLGLHEGPDVDVSAAAALGGLTTERCARLLAGLLGAHLVEETARGRFRLHDLLYLLARDRAESEDTSAGRLAATAAERSWYLHSACAARVALNPHLPPMEPPAPLTAVPPAAFSGRAAALSWYQVEQANLIAASAIAAEHQDLQVAWQLPTAMYAYFELSKSYDHWISTHRTAITSARLLGDLDAQGRVLCNLGNAYRPLGQFDEAATCYREALGLFTDVGYRQGQAKVLGNLASVYGESGRLEQAASTGEAAISLFRELGDQHGEALSLANLGQAQARIGRYDDATTCQQRAIELFSRLGDMHGQARARCNLGVIERALSRLDAAASLLSAAMADFVELGDRYEEATVLVHLADVHAAGGEPAEETRCLTRARDIFRDIGNSMQQRDLERRLAGRVADQ
jgi:tetratricopeptide (TPR) repeat protein